MSKLFVFTGAMFAFILLFPLLWILAVLLAGVAGMVIGEIFPVVTDTLRELFNLPHITNFQIGATLGFFGSAFRAFNFNSNKD